MFCSLIVTIKWFQSVHQVPVINENYIIPYANFLGKKVANY